MRRGDVSTNVEEIPTSETTYNEKHDCPIKDIKMTGELHVCC